jgi:hypothetical protein
MDVGEIFWAEDKEDHPHPIVCLENLEDGKFSACILSSKPTNGNVLMSESYFQKFDGNGIEYKIQFKNSYLVPKRIFKKDVLWLSSTDPQGKLTKEGIAFIETHLSGVEPEFHPFHIKIKAKKGSQQ